MVHISALLASVAIAAFATAMPHGGHLPVQKSRPQSNSCGAPSGGKGTGNGGGKASVPTTAPKAVYFMTNAAANSIVAMKVAANGTLSQGSVTSTGGAGMNGIDSSTGGPAAPDALFSQGAVKVAGNTLLAVNPGSNTVSMFAIDATNPTKLTMVGKPVDTLGEFPVSVTISMTLKQACVANSGAVAGIACFAMSSTGLSPLGGLRPLCLGQTTPPEGPLNTISQTFFNADSSALLTTVKGDPTKNITGFLSVFPITAGKISTSDVQSSPAGTAVLFGTALLPSPFPKNSLFVTDASFGSATLSIAANNTASVSSSTKIADQAATCWAAFSDVTGSAFVTDVAVNHLVEVDPASGTIIKELNSTNGNPGLIDLVAAGGFVYALSPGKDNAAGANVAVFDISGGKGTAKEIQNFGAAAGSAAQGMAFL